MWLWSDSGGITQRARSVCDVISALQRVTLLMIHALRLGLNGAPISLHIDEPMRFLRPPPSTSNGVQRIEIRMLIQSIFQKLGFVGFVLITKDPFDFILDWLKREFEFALQPEQGFNISLQALCQQAILPRCQSIS